jgi:hypothetical protein
METSRARSESHGGVMASGDRQDDDLAEALRAAFSRLEALPMEPGRRATLYRRLIAITNTAKHDTATAVRRLEAFLTGLDGL